MIRDDFEYIIASCEEREKVMCEIYYQGEFLGEISQETEELLLEIYPNSTKKCWAIPLSQFQEALKIAKQFLLGIEA